MAIYKISYNSQYKRANIHNFGCNFNCPWCSHKLHEKRCFPKFLGVDGIKEVLKKLAELVSDCRVETQIIQGEVPWCTVKL